jgi:serine/threonine-protein kinase
MAPSGIGETPRHELALQLRAEQRQRWRQGERPLVEELLQPHATLQTDQEAVLELIYNEVVLREERGEGPTLGEYRQRFPALEEPLRLQFEVHAAMQADMAADRPLEQRTVVDGAAHAPPPDPPSVPGYEVLRELGHGGMGVVYLARHLPLSRTVALKMILAGRHAPPEVVARFLREAEAVARLQHPNIVQIYEVGEANGQPFLALEFVSGGSLEAKLAGKPLPPPAAAQLVQTLAQAMHHAHQQGVVHRDLKPANVLLSACRFAFAASDPANAKRQAEAGDDFVPKITDFGLARRLDQAGQTHSAIVGTPSYMAPEQARGEKVGPAADVYALGAILYECLTGRPPFLAATLLETLAQVISEDPAPPRQLNPAVPRDLAAICLKSLEKSPRRRYASAAEMAADLGRHLNGEPVLARPAGLARRSWKWVRRRPTAASLLAVSVLAAAALLAAGTSYTAALAEHNRELDAEKQNTERALERSQTAEKSAAQQRQLALKTVRRVVDRIHARLKDLPNQQDLRKDLLAEALAGLKEVARAADTLEADQDTIGALLELGDVFAKIEIGGLEEARKQYETAHALARKLAEADPRSAQVQRDLSVSLERLGDVQRRQGESKAALASFQESLQICRRLVEADPRSAQDQRGLIFSLLKVGEVQNQQGDSKAALASFLGSVQGARRLAEANPGSALAQRDLSTSLEQLGDMQIHQGKSKVALASYQEALQIRRRLAADAPRSVEAQRDLSLSLIKLGDVRSQLGDSKAALSCFQEAEKICRRLAEADPRSAQAQSDLSLSLNKLGEVQSQQGERKAALASFLESLQIRRRLAEADPRSAQAQRDLSLSLNRLGDVQRRQGENKAALASFLESLQIRRRLAEADPRSAQAQRDLSVSLVEVGDVQRRQREDKAALVSFQEALKIRRRLAAADPRSLLAQRDLTASLDHLGDVQRRQGDTKAALDSYLESLQISRRLAAADPRSAVAQRDLSVSLLKVGDVQSQQGDSKAALASFLESLQVARRLADADPRSAVAQRDLIISYFRLGNLAQQSSDFAGAIDWYSRGLHVSSTFARPGVFKREVAALEYLVSFCQTAEQGVADLGTIDKQPASVQAKLLVAVLRALVKRNERGKAVQVAETLADRAHQPGEVYIAACAFGVCVPLASPDKEKDHLANRAMKLLRQAVAAGFKDVALMKRDTDLDALRQRDDFHQLLRQMENARAQ